ncbi:hypothetical protein RVR_8355 [Actinacidiphila reveromycinica]|uniref:Uncharacterized protein n=2 Tax=Actinacidiphila reveromycinica TaxID=659352 RepID=A0A7U3UYK8_9ACTN|nr:hypothetical protein RVR_8355 [Streptomyces sp. SN-593]
MAQHLADQTSPWPEGVIARYATVGGATVDVTSAGRGKADYRCGGCPFGSRGFGWAETVAHEHAQAHSEKCRALPRPAVKS